MNETTEIGTAEATGPDGGAVLADTAAHLLVVDDDQRIRDLLSRYLIDHGYRVTVADTAASARRYLEGLSFDLLILDLMMPGENGLDFARDLRTWSDVPILMLTAKTETSERIEGLEVGADDYLGKPFDPRELLLRITSILRRHSPPDDGKGLLRFGEFGFDPARGELTRGGEPVRLTDREREMLMIFAANSNETVPRYDLSGAEGQSSERAVDVQINRLRRKLEDDPTNPRVLQTVRGIGYRLVAEME